jgi:hypothetical protein
MENERLGVVPDSLFQNPVIVKVTSADDFVGNRKVKNKRFSSWCYPGGVFLRGSLRSVTGGDLRNRCAEAGSRCLFSRRTQAWRELWLQIWCPPGSSFMISRRLI